MKVNEIFYSLQGEGRLAGVPSVFLRFAGCPLRCRWCDTAYAWSDSAGDDMTVEEIVRKCSSFECDHLVVTGGEPFCHEELGEALESLRPQFRHITIETAGIGFLADLDVDLVSISPKLQSSLPVDIASRENHLELISQTDSMIKLMRNYDVQLKFVVEDERDIEEVMSLLAKLPSLPSDRVMLMPQSRTREEYVLRAEDVAEICIKHGFSFSPRLHVLLWSDRRGV